MTMAETAEVLPQIHAEQREAGETVPEPADPAAIGELQAYTRTHLGAELAPGYVAFLGRANGLDFNGTVIYATRQTDYGNGLHVLGFRESNDLFRSGDERSHILYGETGDELFAHDTSDDSWHILDRGSLTSVEDFRSFDDLLSRILTRAYET
jgi:hypothetical protein